MRSEERLEAIVDQYWDIACMFVGDDANLRNSLEKLGDSVSRLWTATDKGDAYRVALAALAVYRRWDDVFRPLEEADRESLAKHEEQARKRVKEMTAVTRESPERRSRAIEAYDCLLKQGRKKSYAKAVVTAKYCIGVRSLERWVQERDIAAELDKQRAAANKLNEERATAEESNDLPF
jgi:hypothetical protein